MNKTVKFINENSIDEILAYIEKNKINPEQVINSSKQARKEIGLKIEYLIQRLEVK